MLTKLFITDKIKLVYLVQMLEMLSLTELECNVLHVNQTNTGGILLPNVLLVLSKNTGTWLPIPHILVVNVKTAPILCIQTVLWTWENTPDSTQILETEVDVILATTLINTCIIRLQTKVFVLIVSMTLNSPINSGTKLTKLAKVVLLVKFSRKMLLNAQLVLLMLKD